MHDRLPAAGRERSRPKADSASFRDAEKNGNFIQHWPADNGITARKRMPFAGAQPCTPRAAAWRDGKCADETGSRAGAARRGATRSLRPRLRASVPRPRGTLASSSPYSRGRRTAGNDSKQNDARPLPLVAEDKLAELKRERWPGGGWRPPGASVAQGLGRFLPCASCSADRTIVRRLRPSWSERGP